VCKYIKAHIENLNESFIYLMHSSEIKNQLKVTNTIYIALLSGLVIFFIVVIILIQNKNLEVNTELDKIFTFLIPVFGLVMMFTSRMIYNQMISKYDSGSSLLQKIGYYRTAKIISWAMIEGACFFALVATILTANYLYIAVFIFLIGYYLMIRPSGELLIKDMYLNSEESELILRK
jgi:predicted membrane channel-forming protein YqfA (hemolysin III family)